MKINQTLTIMVFLAIFLAGFNIAFADSYSETIDVFKKSDTVKPFFENCYGYAVFPTIGKGGIGIGGAYGTGRVYAKGAPTGTAKLFKGTIGFQLGGQAFSQMIFFRGQACFRGVHQRQL